jgi:hypothetical protein
MRERRNSGEFAAARRALYDAALAYAASARERNETQRRQEAGDATKDELHEANMLAISQGLRLERRARAFATMATAAAAFGSEEHSPEIAIIAARAAR